MAGFSEVIGPDSLCSFRFVGVPEGIVGCPWNLSGLEGSGGVFPEERNWDGARKAVASDFAEASSDEGHTQTADWSPTFVAFS